MSSHAFTMEVTGFNAASERFEDALFDAGCSDALVVLRDRKLFLDFDRESPSYQQAVQSARRDIERAGGRVVQVLPIPEPGAAAPASK